MTTPRTTICPRCRRPLAGPGAACPHCPSTPRPTPAAIPPAPSSASGGAGISLATLTNRMRAAGWAEYNRRKREEQARKEAERRKGLGLVTVPPTAGDRALMDALTQKLRRTVDRDALGLGGEPNYRKFDAWRQRKGRIT